ncbi:chloroperoxidase [Salipaludibacillus neizhouensis]|uniref:Chloroperoxidase n=1 Tax=Salipaludibacillus neizhouensis TaxID=885475 RepID=A0A3A9KT91_9BACI|nr:vanadium-dependent haloperoxidase [Salipaludibacillus neizhouensis]RKL67846.1 chloroperoxidase [Salipaludibacillus neizhouensis]
MKETYLRWSETPYAGENKSPDNPITPLAGSWPLTFLNRDKNGKFLDPTNNRMILPIKHPNQINFDMELLIVQKTLDSLSDSNRRIGIYYGTGVPTKQWTPVIDRLNDTYDVSPTHAARILSAVQGAITDAMIVTWYLKYKWDSARPNQYDQTMKTLLCTPRFPSYPSGHSTMSGCAEIVLSYFFPKESNKLQKVAYDNAFSRLYAGVHFPSDNTEGLKLGRYIGELIVKHLKSQHNREFLPVDNPYRDFKDADIFPTDYQQFITYDFPETCTSLLKGEKVSHQEKNLHLPKPLLY